MPPSISIDDALNLSLMGTPAPVRSGSVPNVPRTRRRFWSLLAITLVLCTLFSPPLWHALLRGILVRLAAQRGCEVAVGRMQGGPFDTIQLYDVRWHPRDRLTRMQGGGTDLRVAYAEVTLAWRLPWLQKPTPSAVQRLVLDGISGRWDLAVISGHGSGGGASISGRWLDRLADRLVPTNFFVRADDLTLQRNRYRLRASGLRLSGERGASGAILAREVEIAGPGFENTLFNRHGQTLWQGNRFSLGGLDLGPGVQLLNATLDGTHLKRQRLDWECALTAMGGEIRGQGSINFVHPRLALEVAGSLHRLPLAPLARLLGVVGAAGGQVNQGSFSFRGDPENWMTAQMWLTAQATDFRWGQRDWQNLELRATVLHQRIRVDRLELQQSRNRVSLTGECPLFAPGQGSARWWEAGFSCDVDARLDDLHALAQLFGHRLPDLDGRMSINGTLATTPGRPGIDGYLSVEGSRLRVRGAPLDYLHSTLLFRGQELNVADVQATRGGDYFAGRGRVNLAGAPGYQGELHVAMADPDLYTPAFSGIADLPKAGLPADGFQTPVRLDGVFYGPDAGGKTVFLTFGGDGWGDDWWGLIRWHL